MTITRWGAVAFFLVAIAFIVAPLVYLTGTLTTPYGPLAYDLADLLYGPVWGASLVMGIFALKEWIGPLAVRRMSLALAAATLAAGTLVIAASIRSANRHYHISHPELNLESSTSVLAVWTTLLSGLGGAGWHFLGWALLLVAWAGWQSGRIPRPLCIFYLVVAAMAFVTYVQPAQAEGVAILGAIASVWQGILLWRAKPDPAELSEA